MIRKALLLSIAFFVGINATLFSQSLLKHIPDDVTFVTTLNPSALNAKIPFSKLKEYDFFKMSMKEMAKELDRSNQDEMLKMLNDPSSFGMDLMSSSYIFGRITEEGNAFGVMFKLSDAAKFTEFFKSKLPADIEIVAADGFNIIAPDQDVAFAWTKDFALITGVEVHRKREPQVEEYIFEEEPVEEDMEIIEEEIEIEEDKVVEEPPVEEEKLEREEIEEDHKDHHKNEKPGESHSDKERKFTLDWVKKIMNSDGSASVVKNSKFMLANAKKTDANLWLDYSAVYKLYMDKFMDSRYMRDEAAMFNELISTMYDDTYMSVGLNFDAGAVNFNVDSYGNNQMMKFYRESTDAKFNKKFHKYIPGENLMGYWSFNLNLENTVSGYKDLFLPMMSNIPMYGPMANDVMDIMDIFIDEQAIYDLWKGDMLFAVTGLREFEKTVTSYEYDEDFNKKEVQVKTTQKLPEFVMMSSYGNEENVLKFIKLGEKTPFLEKKGHYYKATVPEADMDIYLALHKGILFFTNNIDLIENRLDSGYSKKERMSKAQCKQIKNNSMVFHWDIPKTINAASSFGIPLGGPQGKLLNVSKDSFESINWTAPKGGENSINQTISLNFVNKEMNAMEQIFNYINEVAMTMMGGTSM